MKKEPSLLPSFISSTEELEHIFKLMERYKVDHLNLDGISINKAMQVPYEFEEESKDKSKKSQDIQGILDDEDLFHSVS